MMRAWGMLGMSLKRLLRRASASLPSPSTNLFKNGEQRETTVGKQGGAHRGNFRVAQTRHCTCKNIRCSFGEAIDEHTYWGDPRG